MCFLPRCCSCQADWGENQTGSRENTSALFPLRFNWNKFDLNHGWQCVAVTGVNFTLLNKPSSHVDQQGFAFPKSRFSRWRADVGQSHWKSLLLKSGKSETLFWVLTSHSGIWSVRITLLTPIGNGLMIWMTVGELVSLKSNHTHTVLAEAMS